MGVVPKDKGTDELVDLHDGTEAVVRPISPADAEAMLRFHSRLSARTIQLRYFSPHKNLSPEEVAHLTQVDGVARVALVVEHARELIAIGRYDRLDDYRVAEVAFVVVDAYQHHGLATILLQHLADTARSVGITRFTAEILADNRAMLSVFHDAGFPTESKTECGTVELTMTIAPDSGVHGRHIHLDADANEPHSARLGVSCCVPGTNSDSWRSG
jgi:GNAT superfamily N-acetyltransferase